jgi:hypothetical protein
VDPRPGAAALSTTITDKPFLANSNATDEPITPAPITTASHLLVIKLLLNLCITLFQETNIIG